MPWSNRRARLHTRSTGEAVDEIGSRLQSGDEADVVCDSAEKLRLAALASSKDFLSGNRYRSDLDRWNAYWEKESYETQDRKRRKTSTVHTEVADECWAQFRALTTNMFAEIDTALELNKDVADNERVDALRHCIRNGGAAVLPGIFTKL